MVRGRHRQSSSTTALPLSVLGAFVVSGTVLAMVGDDTRALRTGIACSLAAAVGVGLLLRAREREYISELSAETAARRNDRAAFTEQLHTLKTVIDRLGGEISGLRTELGQVTAAHTALLREAAAREAAQRRAAELEAAERRALELEVAQRRAQLEWAGARRQPEPLTLADFDRANSALDALMIEQPAPAPQPAPQPAVATAPVPEPRNVAAAPAQPDPLGLLIRPYLASWHPHVEVDDPQEQDAGAEVEAAVGPDPGPEPDEVIDLVPHDVTQPLRIPPLRERA